MTNPDIKNGPEAELDKLTALFEKFIQTGDIDAKLEITKDIEHRLAVASDSGLDVQPFYKIYVELMEADGAKAFEHFTQKTGITREDLQAVLKQLTQKSPQSN